MVTSSPTTNWPVFSNASSQYQIKYPQDWSFKLLGKGTLQLFTSPSNNPAVEPDAAINVYVINNPSSTDPLTFLRQISEEGVSTEGATEFGYPSPNLGLALFIPVNGTRAMKIPSTDGFSQSHIYVPQHGRFIILDSIRTQGSIPLDQFLNMIVSTLKF